MQEQYAEYNETAERLVTAAIALFAERWYSSVSVAEICRGAGLSNGIFYRYFPNKESVMRRILEDVNARIGTALEAVAGDTPEERLASMASLLMDYSAANPERITVFREGQYRFFEFELKLTDQYRRTLAKAIGRQVDMAEYLFAVGGIRFCSVRAALHGARVSKRALNDIVTRGLFRGLDWDADKVFGITVNPPTVPLREGTRESLLRAGKRLFGERGYHEVNIHEITDAASLSVGAFYKYFTGKDAFFAELIESAGREIRHFISSHLSPGLNRLEREMQGIFLFGVFLSLDKWCYNIVREGEFIAPAKVREYYAAFEQGYRRTPGNGLDPAALAADPLYEDTAIEFLLGIAHYYGIEMVFDVSPRNARALVEGIGACLSGGIPGSAERAVQRVG